MDEDGAVPAEKAEQSAGAPHSEDGMPNSNDVAIQSRKRKREEDDKHKPKESGSSDEHKEKGKNKYRQRTFQHGSRKHRGDKRKNLGREEYLYVFELHSVSRFPHLPKAYTSVSVSLGVILCNTN